MSPTPSLPRIDFYVVADPSTGAAGVVACRLAEKAWLGGHRVYLHTASPDSAARLDDALWTFRQDSFVPHGRFPEQSGEDLPVLVGCGGDPDGFGDVLINLTEEVPAFYRRFSRVLEVVGADPAAKEAARGRFRIYQKQGYPLHSHEV
jgi:DNA polymerase-3 subunit chi